MSDGRPEEIAQGVYRLGTRWVNFHLIVDGEGAILVDSGYPGYVGQLEDSLASLGRELGSIAAVLVTHHHVDHAGTAEAVRSRVGATVFAGEGDKRAVEGVRASHPPAGFYREAWRPSMFRYLAHTVRVGGARYRPVAKTSRPDTGTPLDLPGRPRVIETPGHTAGHYSVHLAERGVLLCGDAMVNFDYASGEAGIALHRFNEDPDAARVSLGRLEELDAEIVVFGHGDPFTGSPARAVALARERP